jgi:hypothetical protein
MGLVQSNKGRCVDGRAMINLIVCRVLRDVIPPTPPGPEGSNGNGSLRAQWVARYIFLPHLAGVWFCAMAQWTPGTFFAPHSSFP